MTTFFTEIKGYSTYTKTQFDYQLKEDWTKDVVDVIEELILNGLSRHTIIDSLVEELKFTVVNARTLYNKVESKVYKKGADKKKLMLSKNIMRLEHIYNKSMRENNIANALKAIETLNKMCNIYTNQIELNQNNFVFRLGDTAQPQQLPESIEITPIEVVENNEENTITNNAE